MEEIERTSGDVTETYPCDRQASGEAGAAEGPVRELPASGSEAPASRCSSPGSILTAFTTQKEDPRGSSFSVSVKDKESKE
jgi:hypothetical protein